MRSLDCFHQEAIKKLEVEEIGFDSCLGKMALQWGEEMICKTGSRELLGDHLR